MGIFRTTLFIFLTLALISCSSSHERYSSEALPPVSERPVISSADQGERLPWEVWALGRDLKGTPLTDRMLLEGDEFIRRGDRAQGLKVYRAIDLRRLSPAEREATVVRIASAELALDRAREALQTLSGYFRTERKAEAEVDPRLCLLFGYAYGRLNDLDQSLAWFARSYRVGKSAGLSESASLGVRTLLRTVEDTPLYQLTERWRTDAFIRPLIGQERRRRVQAGYVVASNKFPFWLSESNLGSAGSLGSGPELGSHSIVGVVLPLSGPFASLGRATKQGIELAFEGYSLTDVSMEVRDDAGDALQAVTAVRELVNSSSATVILGPLLTEAAVQVSQLMRSERRPMLSFAKSGNFQAGDGMYRLGPTAESQVDSLVDGVHRRFGYSRYAVVYPLDPAGEEFAALFRTRIQDLGLQVVMEASYQRDDFSALFAIAQEAREKNLDAVFFPDSLKTAARFFSYLNVGGGRTVRPIGTASWDNAAELQQSRAILEGSIFVSPFLDTSARPDITKFKASYHSRFGVDPDFLAAQGFDAGALVLEGLRRARAESAPFDEGLRRVGAYEGLTGTIEIRPDGAIRRQFKVAVFERGAVTELEAAPVLSELDAAAASAQSFGSSDAVIAESFDETNGSRSSGIDVGGLPQAEGIQ